MEVLAMIGRSITVCALGLAVLASPFPAASAPHIVHPLNNVLIIVGDDVGIDVLEMYDPAGEWGITDLAPTPTLDSLAANGIRFENVWANPVCCPTRATIQTGRYGFRTGILSLVPEVSDRDYFGLDLETERLLPRVLADILQPRGVPVRSAAFGKWHLNSGDPGDPTWKLAPNLGGYDHYSGSLFNIRTGESYFSWTRTENGEGYHDDRYATTANVDDAYEWIATQESFGRPWFVYLAFNAPHHPYHEPPDDLHTRDLAGVNCCETPRPCYLAMIEAMDREIGRLLAQLDRFPGDVLANTTVFFIGDNGTPRETTAQPFDPMHAKQTLYEGGIRVPLIASGFGVRDPGRSADALINAADLFATTLELFVGPHYRYFMKKVMDTGWPVDSQSFAAILSGKDLDVREYALAEARITGASGKTIRNLIRGGDDTPVLSYKFILFESLLGVLENPQAGPRYEIGRAFYDLLEDPFELNNLYPGGITPDNLDVYLDLCQALQALVQYEEPLECIDPRAPGGGELTAPLAYVPPQLRQPEVILESRPNPIVGAGKLCIHCSPAVRTGTRGSVELYHESGRRVRSLWEGPGDGLPRELTWDGCDDEGSPVAPGRYLAGVRLGNTFAARQWITVLR
ncbi:MAG: sulfatase-like hydrolase/transferase [Candidatus Eisenbacteria bacterium]|nr:sulfatase-like hydrolase/transferase [Candidatus Eisenbacteria bacterium]